MSIPKPRWFSPDTVMVSTAPTVGISKSGGLLAKFDLCGGSRGECLVGQSIGERGIACLIEGREPVVEEMAGGAVGDEAHLITPARQVDDDEWVNGADVLALARRHGSVGGVGEDDGVDLVGVVLVVFGRGASSG